MVNSLSLRPVFTDIGGGVAGREMAGDIGAFGDSVTTRLIVSELWGGEPSGKGGLVLHVVRLRILLNACCCLSCLLGSSFVVKIPFKGACGRSGVSTDEGRERGGVSGRNVVAPGWKSETDGDVALSGDDSVVARRGRIEITRGLEGLVVMAVACWINLSA